MKRAIDLSKLMKVTGINHRGKITVTEKMSGLEPNPCDDWLYLALLSIKDLSQRESLKISSIANIGSGNGIETIVELKLFKNLKKIIVTDIIPKILPQIKENIERNCPSEVKSVKINYVSGRDCEPVEEKVDFIYANLPLIMVSEIELNKNLSTTTLTEAKHYLHLSGGNNDILQKYSLLSQLGFLLSAKEKLNKNGVIITLLGGRVPSKALNNLFERAGLKYRELYCAFKIQSDPQFLKQYAKYEEKEKVRFFFYNYKKAAKLIKDKLEVEVPNVIRGYSGDQLKELLHETYLNANEAYALAKRGEKVGHIAFAFEVTL